MFFHVFAQTTHVVAAPHGFACVVIPATRLYIPSFIEIRSGVSEPRGVKIWPFPLLWLVAFTTACTTVQAVISSKCIPVLLYGVESCPLTNATTDIKLYSVLDSASDCSDLQRKLNELHKWSDRWQLNISY